MHAGGITRWREAGSRILAALALLAAVAAGAPEAGAAEPKPTPQLDARAWVLVDARDGERLAAKASGKQLPIASATKLMTAYLTLQALPLDRRIKAAPYSAIPAESVVGLRAGEMISARDLLVAMMLPSANDAAFTLANEISGSVPKFVKRMNRAARKLGLDDTSYANPIGLDDPLNGSSARDLAALTLELRRDARFRKIVGKAEATLKSGAVRRRVQTRNTLLLADGSVDGVKTGHTQGAGYVLVASAEREGVQLVSAVLGAGSEGARDAESERLLDYGFSLYRPRPAVKRGEVVGAAAVSGEGDPLELVAGRGERVVARSDQRISVEIAAPEEVAGPLDAGERLGRAAVLVDGRRAGSVPVAASRAVAAPTVLDRAEAPLAAIFIAGGSILILIALVFGMRRARNAPGDAVGRTPEQRRMSHTQRARRRNQEGKES